MTAPWATAPQTPLPVQGHYPPQPNLTARPFRVRIHGHRAVRVHAKSAFQAACIALNRKGLRYAETTFRVEEVTP